MSDLDERDAGDAVDLLGSGIATVAGAAGGAQVGKEAATGAAIGAAVGSVLEVVPVAGPILHAIAIAAGAIGGAISGALRDKYHPSALQAALSLLLCRIAPGMIYAGFDRINTETRNAAAYACRLVRYWRLLAGLVKFTGPLYNPRSDGYRALLTDRPKKQPYIESGTPDPQEALTDVRVTRHVRDLVVHFGHQPAAPEILPLIRTQADAQAILAALRAYLGQSGVLGWDPIKTNLPGLRIAVGKVMTIAGETEPDPILSNLLGGVVWPQALRRRDRGPHAPAAARRAAAPHGHPARPAAAPRPPPAWHPAAHVEVSADDPFTELRAGEAGDPSAHASRLIRLLPAILRMRRERGESTAPLSNCVVRPEEIVAAEARLGAEAAGVTDVGRQRKQNEDCLLLRPDLALFGVADGMGGHNAGDVASERVTAALGKHFEATALGPVHDELPDEYASLSPGARRLAAGMAEANRDVYALSKTHPQHRGMGSTGVALHLAEGMAHVAHVGDSRCYRIRDGQMVQMTRDHSLVNDARDMKPKVTEEYLATLPKNIITRALGTKEVVKVDVQSEPTLPGDVYLLCSDGLTGMLPDEEILNVIRCAADAQEACERLIADANARGGTDNISALIVRIASRDRELGLAERDTRGERARERAAALLLRLVDREDLDGAEEDVGAPGPGRCRVYTPPAHQQEDSGHREPGREPRAQAVFPGLVLVHGVTPQGIDAPRLVRLAKALAASGLTVLTPEIPELAGGRLDPSAVDSIAQAVIALADRTGAPVGLVGLSIAGGLSLLAAAEPRCADSLSFVCAIGAHHDLGRVARFCLTNRVERIDEGWHPLEADPAGRRMLADILLDGANEAQGDLLAALAEAREALAALSPAGRLGDLSVPVFVLHGAEDNVIPAAEAEWIARELPVGMLRRQLVTPALFHVDVGALGEVGADETAVLVEFLADLLAHAETMAAPFTDPEDPHQGETMYDASAPLQVLPTGAAPAEAGTVFDDAAARATQAVEEARAYLSETWLGKALGIEPEPKPPRTADPGFELYSAGDPPVLPREGDASAPADSEASGLLDLIFDPEAREAERLPEREALKRIPWVKDGALGRFLNLDEPAPLPAPTRRPRPLVLVPEAAGEAGAIPTSMDADAVRKAILAAPPRAVPPAWKALDAPAQLYWWDPFGETWARMGDGRDREVAKVLAVFFLKETHFPVSYCLLHSAEGSEVIRAEKNASQDPRAGEGQTAEWRPDKAGVSHLWIPAYTFYARSFPPGETVRFDFAGAAGGGNEAGAPAGWEPTYLTEPGPTCMPPGEASGPLAPREDANGKKDYYILRNLAWPRLLAWLAEHPIPEADPFVAIWKRFETDWEAGDERPYGLDAQWENFVTASSLAAARGYVQGVGLNEDAPREGARRLAFVRPTSPDGEAAAPIGAVPETALEQLLIQLDHRYPYRGEGSLDGVHHGVLRITDDPGRNGRRRTGPNLAELDRVVCADARTLKTQRMSGPDGINYLAIIARQATAGDTSAWDLSGLSTRSETGASEGDTGYPARPSLAALRKLEEELDAAWPQRRKKWGGGNMSDTSPERDRGVLDVPESSAGCGPALADLQAAVKRDARVVETEIVTPSLWNSVPVPTLRVFTAERGTDASPWDLSAPATGPRWENYGRRLAELAEFDARGPGDLGEARGLDTGTPRWQHTMSQMAGVHAGPTHHSPRVAEIAAGTPVRVVRRAVDEFGDEWASIEWAPGFGRRGDGWARASLLGGYDTAGEAGDAGGLSRTYQAEGGETPQAIATRYGALGRSHWAAELRAANPARDWRARIYSGDRISIPEAWPMDASDPFAV